MRKKLDKTKHGSYRGLQITSFTSLRFGFSGSVLKDSFFLGIITNAVSTPPPSGKANEQKNQTDTDWQKGFFKKKSDCRGWFADTAASQLAYV